jgi:hypothetical protein
MRVIEMIHFILMSIVNTWFFVSMVFCAIGFWITITEPFHQRKIRGK